MGRPSAAGPVLICVFLLVSYVGCSSVLLAQLQGTTYLNSLYYCFMTILTVGHNSGASSNFGGGGGGAAATPWGDQGGGTTTEQASLFGSLLYILIGLILEATCVHILYEEVYLKRTSSSGDGGKSVNNSGCGGSGGGRSLSGGGGVT